MEQKISAESPYLIPVLEKDIKDFIKEIPKSPGVYKFLDKSSNPIYIGKAKLLNKRVASYFRKSSRTKKIIKLRQQAKFIEFVLTNTELESLLHEQFLIKEFKPKFNVQFKDDKGYPWIKIDTSQEFPSAKSFLGRKQSNNKFFGPFPSSYAVQESLRLLQKTFKIRNCSDSYFKNRTRPCLQNEIGRCSAPCVGSISKEEYAEDVNSAQLLLTGKSETLISSFYKSMDKHSKNKSFERAAMYRDKISSLRDIQRLQSISGHPKERDAISVYTVNGQSKAGITHVKGGWVTGHENFTQQNLPIEGSVIEHFIKMHYLNDIHCPPFIVIGETIKNKAIIESALSSYHSKNVKIINKPGKKDRGLLEICENNTKFSFRKNSNSRSIIPALTALKEELSLTHKINIIESYDVSHHSGSAAVAGCVVYSENGKARDKYRMFNISKKNSGDDIASMVEVIERRFSNKNLKLNKPNLIIVDGGKTHLAYVAKRLEKLKLGNISVIAISKGVRRKSEMDSIHRMDGTSMKVAGGSLAHKFIQEIRDETHRFSITMQKKKLRKLSSSSSLDSLIGVGLKRKKQLIRYFGSLEQIKRASAKDLLNVPGIGKKTASLLYEQLK